MKRVFWSETHITVLTEIIEAKPHAHLMLQIFIKRDKPFTIMVEGNAIVGNYIVVDSNVEHSIAKSEELDCFILIEATSVAALQLRDAFMKGQGYSLLPAKAIREKFISFYNNPNELSHNTFSTALFQQLGISFRERNGYDERITALLEMLGEYTCVEDSIDEIAKRLHLSTSRLSHLFREQTGVPLKSYIVLFKLQKAYLLLFKGESITNAALNAGFYSPSHLADVNRRMMGMTISESIQDSCFLEA